MSRAASVVRALLDSDGEVLTATLRQAGPRYVHLAAAVTAGALLDRWLGPSPDASRLVEAAKTIYDGYANPEALPYMAVETFVRGGFGDEDLLQSAPEEWRLPTQMLISYGVGHELRRAGESQESLVDAVVPLVEAVVQQHAP